jgi:uncharacterized GH25 family protein
MVKNTTFVAIAIAKMCILAKILLDMNTQKPIRTFFVCMALAVSGLLWGHEFWIQPNDFFPKIGDVLNISLLIGENFEGKRWGGGSKRIDVAKIKTATQWLPVAIQQSDSLVEPPSVKITETGTQVFTLVTNNSFIDLEPKKFEEYLKEDGLDNALQYRQQNNENTQNGRELYRRCAKTIWQVGRQSTPQAMQRSDMILDIVPSKNPYLLTKNEPLRCQFRYDDANMTNALVRCWRRVDGKTEIEFKKTDNQGFALFELTKKGTGVYMISTVKMIRLNNNPKADWQSTWGSVTFAIK